MKLAPKRNFRIIISYFIFTFFICSQMYTVAAQDTDGDSIPDITDVDDDNDGILDELECVVLDASDAIPDGLEDGNFGYGYWDAEYYSGHFGIAGSTFGNSNQNSTITSAPGTPIFLGEAFLGINNLNFTETRSYGFAAGGGFETNTTSSLVPTNYVGTNIESVNHQPYFQTIFKREAEADGVLNFGGAGNFTVDDVFELFVNNTRVVFSAFCCGATSSPNTVFNINVNSGDLLEIRYTNLGYIGGFQFNLVLNPTACQDTDLDGIPNQLDLDSDGDGCPDAVEGGDNISYSQVLQSNIDGGNSGGAFTGFAGLVQDNLTGDLSSIVDPVAAGFVDTDGRVIRVNGGTPPGTNPVAQTIGEGYDSTLYRQCCELGAPMISK